MWRILSASIGIGCSFAAFLYGWWWANDRPECRQSSDFGTCVGSGIGMIVFGLPALVLAWWLLLKYGTARHSFLGLVVIGAICWVLALATEPLDPPFATWPVLAGVVAGGYLAVDTRIWPTD